MKIKFLTYGFPVSILFLFASAGFSQNMQDMQQPIEFRVQQTECLSDEARALIKEEIAQSILQLKAEGRLLYNEHQAPEATLFSWPIRAAANSPVAQPWGVSNYVDHDPSQGLRDFDCKTRTYNGHQGIDIAIWPFWWYLMDTDQVENVAAAPGQIVHKRDGFYDRSCAMNGGQWNAIYVQHADGSIAWYGHMKKNSLTSKGVGDTVQQGEFLGITGSSGNSTGPHLHFEIYSPSGALIDPYAGSCNPLNNDSWWNQQSPHSDPSINAVFTHSAPPIFPDCPAQEIPNFKNNFDFDEKAYFAIYLSHQEVNTTLSWKLLAPAGALYDSGTIPLNNTYVFSYWYISRTMPYLAGTWTWSAEYNGKTVSHEFKLGVLGVEDLTISDLKFYPNPVSDILEIEASDNIVTLEFYNVTGRKVFSLSDPAGVKQVDMRPYASGLYFAMAKDAWNRSATFKVVKE